MKQAKKRTIYNNYDLWEDLSDDARDFLIDEKEMNEDEITDEDIWNEIYAMDENYWDDEKYHFEKFFDNGSTWILSGCIERWNGSYEGGFIFKSFSEMIRKAGQDCDYFHFYDENGHFYLQCSHHDGTNLYEIKKLTKKGEEYYDRWVYGTDLRSEHYVYDMIMRRYSILPHYLHTVYGCPKVEYKKEAA